MARGQTGKGKGKGQKQSKIKGLVANPKYSVRRRTTYTEKDFQKGGTGAYILAAYGDLASPKLKAQADTLAEKGGFKKLRNSSTVALSIDGKRIVKIPTDG